MEDLRAKPAMPVLFKPARLKPAILPWMELGVLLTALVWLSSPALGQTGATVSKDRPAALRGIELRKAGEELTLHFQLSAPANFEVVANLPRRVLVIKFANVRPNFPNDKREFAYNDPMVVGIAFEDVNGRDTWAKIRLRTPHLIYRMIGESPGNQMKLSLKPAPFPEGILLSGLRLGDYRGGSRLVLDVSALPLVEENRDGDRYFIRLKGVIPQLSAPAQAEDRRIAVLSADEDGKDTLVRILLKQGGLQPRFIVLPAPPRVVFDFRKDTGGVVREQEQKPGKPLPRASGDIPLEVLLEREQNPLVTANYLLAEREFRSENYARANLLFLRVFDTVTDSLLGVRAYFRAADSQYQRNVSRKATNYHDVIINYQAAIRAAEKIGYRTTLIPHSLFRIGRAYQRMGFHFESNVHYQILQIEHPENFPYTPDSYFYQGINFLDMGKFTDSVGSFKRFLGGEGDDALQGAAHYHLGDSYYNLKQFVEAKTEFDRGREIDPNFADSRPLLMFHMGEAYYENAEFDLARIVYQSLLEQYPEKNYTKLVGLRLGDFLREEGKEKDAMRVYRLVTKDAPIEIRLRGKLRIANLLASHPSGNDYKEALQLYDEVVKEGEGRLILQEALLRKGLTLTLHGQNQPAIDTFEKLAGDHPQGPFTRDNLIKDNIEENLKTLMGRLYFQKKFWDVARIYTRYQDRYFRSFRFPYTLIQAADAYWNLGLYDESIGLYDELIRRGAGPLRTLMEIRKAHAYLDKDDLGKAEESLLKFIQERRKDVYMTDARMLLGKVYFTGRRYQEAVKAYTILVREFERSKDPLLGESIGEVYFELGEIFKELGRNKEALDSYQAGVDNFHHPIQGPSVPEFIVFGHFRIGDMLFELGQNRDAIAAYERAISLYPDHDRAPWANYQIGLIYRRLGEDRKALDIFSALVEKAKEKPGELWEPLSRENQRDLANKLDYQKYLKQ